MSYIEPNTDIWLLRGVNLETDYTHTVYHEYQTSVAVSINLNFVSFVN